MATKSKSNPIPLKTPALIDITADATHQGKSHMALRLRGYLDSYDIPNILVRLESQRVVGVMREGDIQIASEAIAKAGQVVGGVVGVLRPLMNQMTKAIERGEVVIFDWAGGLGQHRATFYVTSHYDEFLQKKGVTPISFVVTTAHIDRMREATAVLENAPEFTPAMRSVLVLNGYGGDFDFLSGSESAKKLELLIRKDEGVPVMQMPKIEFLAWQHFAPLGLEFEQVLRADPLDLAAQLGSDEVMVGCCQTHLKNWYDLTQEELERILPFRPEEKSKS